MEKDNFHGYWLLNEKQAVLLSTLHLNLEQPIFFLLETGSVSLAGSELTMETRVYLTL